AIVVSTEQPLAADERSELPESIVEQHDSGPDRARLWLRSLFAEVLDGAEVSDQDSFLDVGGQSVTAMLLISRVNVAFGTDLTIADLFDAPSIDELAARLPSLPASAPVLPISPFAGSDQLLVLAEPTGNYSLWPASIEPPAGWTIAHGPDHRAACLAYVNQHWTGFEHLIGPSAPNTDTGLPIGRYPLSYNQEFFQTLDEGDSVGSFSDRHTLVAGWRIRGNVAPAVLQGALNDLVERHEILRTTIQRDGTPGSQQVHPATPVPMLIRSMPVVADPSREFQCEQLLTEIEAMPIDASELPLLRAVLGRFDHHDSVLVLSVHHIAIDAWSMQVLIRDLAICYARRRGYDLPLPPVHQYREYSLLQRAETDPQRLQPHVEFWQQELAGAHLFEMPVVEQDVPAGLSNYAMQGFVVDGELATSTVELAAELRSSPFMVLLSAFYLLARQITDQTDLLVPTFTTGRTDARFRETVGPFLNFLPVRTDITGCLSFRELVSRTRASCIQAYSHDIPFECIEPQVPGLFMPAADQPGSPVAFEMVQSPLAASGDSVGDLRLREVHRRLLVEGDCPDIPNGMLWVLNLVSRSEIIGTIQFKRSEFSLQAMADLVTGYLQVLRQAVTEPDADLNAVEVAFTPKGL
ncbi:MAG: condensation domain-containing protein, partial [Jatrophihabitantaceae bacterium]